MIPEINGKSVFLTNTINDSFYRYTRPSRVGREKFNF